MFLRKILRDKNWIKGQAPQYQQKICVWTFWTISKRGKGKWPWSSLKPHFLSHPNAVLPKRHFQATLPYLWEGMSVTFLTLMLVSLDYKARMTSNVCLQVELSGNHERAHSLKNRQISEFTSHLQALGITMRSWMSFRMFYIYIGRKSWLNYS